MYAKIFKNLPIFSLFVAFLCIFLFANVSSARATTCADYDPSGNGDTQAGQAACDASVAATGRKCINDCTQTACIDPNAHWDGVQCSVTACASPANFRELNATDTAIGVAWDYQDASGNPATIFELYRNGALYGNAQPSDRSFSFAPLTPNTTYNLAIIADCQSSSSNFVPPTGLNVTTNPPANNDFIPIKLINSQTGALIPGAAFTAKNTTTSIVFNSTAQNWTDSSGVAGNYVVNNVSHGTYNVCISQTPPSYTPSSTCVNNVASFTQGQPNHVVEFSFNPGSSSTPTPAGSGTPSPSSIPGCPSGTVGLITCQNNQCISSNPPNLCSLYGSDCQGEAPGTYCEIPSPSPTGTPTTTVTTTTTQPPSGTTTTTVTTTATASPTNPGGFPDCDTGGSCTQCIGNQNTCNANNGTQSCSLDHLANGGQCTPKTVTSACTVNACAVGFTCSNDQCVNPTTTPTLTPGPLDTLFGLTIGLDGIGAAGDSKNANSNSSNKIPLHKFIFIQVTAIDQNGNQTPRIGVLFYDGYSGTYIGKVNMGPLSSTSLYTAKVKVAKYLQKTVATGVGISSQGSAVQLPSANLVTGDINTDNMLSVLDYTQLISCAVFTQNNNCTDVQKTLADLNDDGVVDQFDYNLFLREFQTIQTGD